MASPAARLGVRQAYRAERAAATPKPPRTPLTIRAAQWAARRLPAWPALRRVVLVLAGFGLLVAAAWQVSLTLGLVAAGVSLLVVEALSGGDR